MAQLVTSTVDGFVKVFDVTASNSEVCAAAARNQFVLIRSKHHKTGISLVDAAPTLGLYPKVPLNVHGELIAPELAVRCLISPTDIRLAKVSPPNPHVNIPADKFLRHYAQNDAKYVLLDYKLTSPTHQVLP
jgi:hypothetical protein